MMINGDTGSQRRHIEDLLTTDHRQQTPVSRIQLTIKQQKLTVQLSEKRVKNAKAQQLFLLDTSVHHALSIYRGKKSGKQPPYFNSVEHV